MKVLKPKHYPQKRSAFHVGRQVECYYLLLTGLQKRPDYVCDPVLGVFDEAGNLGAIPYMAQTISTIGSKMVSLMFLFQDNAQADLVYGEKAAQTMRGNCSYKVAHQLADTETRKYFRDLIGTTTRRKVSKTRSYKPETGEETGYSESVTTDESWIFRDEEFGQLERSVVVTPKGHYSVRGVPYYEDKRFA